MAITISIDWISVTSHKKSVIGSHAHESLRDGKWCEASAKLGYTAAQLHETGVREYKNYDRTDIGVHIVYSSKALAKMNKEKLVSAEEILEYHINEMHNIARLDLAIDFKELALGVDDFVKAWHEKEVRTKLRKASVIKSLVDDGQTLYIGSTKKRKNLVRIYNKSAELGVSGNWVRVELQIMGKKATTTARDIIISTDIKVKIIDVVKSIVHFPTIPAWFALTQFALPFKMESISKNMGDTETWLLKQVSPALARVIQKNPSFWDEFSEAVVTRVRWQEKKEEIKE